MERQLQHERTVVHQQQEVQIEQLKKEIQKKNQHIQYLITQMNKQSQELHTYLKQHHEQQPPPS